MYLLRAMPYKNSHLSFQKQNAILQVMQNGRLK